ncbi:MAG TPA: phosphate acyltransferase PlsX [Dongiaceae bacterium]|jgi:glycerol-3-phosphate acyltransferase PlsX|nr:phosphate acyltransferase PlsX [Dongiaceae bacterium]
MTTPIAIALDAMGGDAAPDIVIAGAELARERFPHARFHFFGPEGRLSSLLAPLASLAACSEIHHTDQVVGPDEKPGQALRAGKDSSMRLAIEFVKEGKAQAVVSAGNTGALMALAKFILRTLPGIDRPAIASFFPTLRSESVMLDLGANISCDAANLVQFAVMGNVFARTVLGVREPSMALLNIGSEEMKGHDVLKEASALLRQNHLPGRFVGFVEGDDITKGTVDVIVTDGFTGNVALKTIEGTVKLYSHFLRQTLRSSWLAQLGYLLCKPALRALRVRVDPRRYNGAIFMGLNGICVKSHGGTDSFGFANAISVAIDMVTHGAIDKMQNEFARVIHQAAAAADV